jgi:hypothetical protein
VKLVRRFAKRSGRGFARSRSAGDVGEALTALRSLGAEAVRLVFAQEIERALRAAMEKGAIPASAETRPTVRSEPAVDKRRRHTERVTKYGIA